MKVLFPVKLDEPTILVFLQREVASASYTPSIFQYISFSIKQTLLPLFHHLTKAVLTSAELFSLQTCLNRSFPMYANNFSGSSASSESGLTLLTGKCSKIFWTSGSKPMSIIRSACNDYISVSWVGLAYIVTWSQCFRLFCLFLLIMSSKILNLPKNRFDFKYYGWHFHFQPNGWWFGLHIFQLSLPGKSSTSVIQLLSFLTMLLFERILRIKVIRTASEEWVNFK